LNGRAKEEKERLLGFLQDPNFFEVRGREGERKREGEEGERRGRERRRELLELFKREMRLIFLGEFVVSFPWAKTSRQVF
jgi:hypothetical protein